MSQKQGTGYPSDIVGSGCRLECIVNNQNFPNIGLDNMVYDLHEGTRNIGQTKQHNKTFEQTIRSFECCFPFFIVMNVNLMVATTKSNLGKVLQSSK